MYSREKVVKDGYKNAKGVQGSRQFEKANRTLTRTVQCPILADWLRRSVTRTRAADRPR